VVTSEKEAEVLSGRRAPEPPSSVILRAMVRVQRPPVVPVDRVAEEGVAVAGFRVLATPGHSLGHTVLLRDEDGVLLAGDAFGELPRGLRVGVRAALCHSPAQALRSARKLLEEDFVTAAFAHGRTLRSGTKETLREVVESCDYE
jgi:glyoxylase-like metal-dependent hydrolase (beta-lactamase superfamily II)